MEYCNGMMYAVKTGDTLYSISMKYNIPLALLLRANPYVDVYNLQPGQTVCVPVRQGMECQPSCQGECDWRSEREEEPAERKKGMEKGETMTEPAAVSATNNQTQTDIEETQTGDRKNLEKDNNLQWERYVTQPGDTLDIMLGKRGMGMEDDWEDVLEDFVEKNGLNRIYLLPGIAYYRQK